MRRPRPSRGASHHVTQNPKGIAVPVGMRGSKLGSRARTSQVTGCRSRQATTAGLTSLLTGRTAGSIERSAGGERGPSPRRRSLLTFEKSRAEAEPRVKQASRGSRRMWRLPRRRRSQARGGRTSAHEGRAMPGSRHGGLSHRGGAKALPPRNGPCRRKALHGSPCPLASHVAVDIDPRQLSPGRAHAKAWTIQPNENRSRRSDTGVRGWSHRAREE